MRAAVAAVLLALAVAGCTAPSQAPTSAPAASGAPEAPITSDTTGAVSGTVVDDAVRPIANATVDLSGGGAHRNATSDARGAFTFASLAPGAYLLTTTAKGHVAAQNAVQVVARAVAKVNVALPSLPSTQGYHQTQHFRGHIDDWLGEASFEVESAAPGTLQCACQWTVRPAGKWSTMVFETTGAAEVPNPGTPGTKAGNVYWEVVSGNGAGVTWSDQTNFPYGRQFTWDNWENGKDAFLVRVTGGVWPSGTMDYEVFVTFFYNGEAPRDWAVLHGSN